VPAGAESVLLPRPADLPICRSAPGVAAGCSVAL